MVEGEQQTDPTAVVRQHGFEPEAFITFWRDYPQKIDKCGELKAFESVARSGTVTFDELIAGLKRYVSTKPPDRPWRNPATWLRQGRWDDDLDHSQPERHSGRSLNHYSPNDAFADAIARNLANHPDSQFYRPRDGNTVRSADAVIAGMARVVAKRFGGAPAE